MKCRVEDIHIDTTRTTIQSHKYGRIERLNRISEKEPFLLYIATFRAVIRGIFRICGPCMEKSGIQSPAVPPLYEKSQFGGKICGSVFLQERVYRPILVLLR